MRPPESASGCITPAKSKSDTGPQFLALIAGAGRRAGGDENQERRQHKQGECCEHQNNGHAVIKGVTKSKESFARDLAHSARVRFGRLGNNRDHTPRRSQQGQESQANPRIIECDHLPGTWCDRRSISRLADDQHAMMFFLPLVRKTR